MVHICHVTNVHPWDDTRIFHKMCTFLAAEGHKVDLVVLDRDGNVPEGDQNGVCVIPVLGNEVTGRLKRATLGAFRVIRAAVMRKPDIVHLHDPELTFLDSLSANVRDQSDF